MDLFLRSGGYTVLSMEVKCPGAKAATRFQTAEPVFYIRESAPPGDVTLVRLTRNRDNRSFRRSSANMSVENKEGFQAEDLRKIAIREYEDGTFSVAPESPLKPGEYLLVVGDLTRSFDFGIDDAKR